VNEIAPVLSAEDTAKEIRGVEGALRTLLEAIEKHERDRSVGRRWLTVAEFRVYLPPPPIRQTALFTS
jgi:hypothetical protein